MVRNRNFFFMLLCVMERWFVVFCAEPVWFVKNVHLLLCIFCYFTGHGVHGLKS